MKPTMARKLANSKRRLARRLDKTKLGDCSKSLLVSNWAYMVMTALA